MDTTTVELMGERVVTSENAFEVADANFEQAECMFSCREGWSTVVLPSGLRIDTKPVCGAFGESGILMTRGEVEIDAAAADIFALLTSPEGYAIIDPMCNPEEFEEYLERFEGWRPGAKLEFSQAFAEIPGQTKREFVVLNAVDPSSLLFTSTSMMHDSRPGGSRFQDEMPLNGDTTIRALNTFAVKCEQTSSSMCKVRFLNWIDLALGNAKATNKLELAWFAPLFHRLEQTMASKAKGVARTSRL
jgi:hypothetical protein